MTDQNATVRATSRTNLASQRCPVCQEPSATPPVVHRDNLIVSAHLLCAHEHLWQVRWIEIA